ncbi:MAG: hypothetical protein EGQ09_21150 [Clostridiales bacterium]|nr:hypothetical protein [Clostridiales bacterium]
MANNHTRRGPGGPGSGPRGGFRKPKDLRGTLGKLMGYLGRYKALLVIVVVLLVISSACSVAGSYLIKPLINNYILPGDFVGLAKMLCVMGGVYAVGALCSYGYARIMVHVAQNTVAKLRADLFNKMQKLPLKFFDTHTHGELMSRYTNDIETVSEALNNSFASLISCSLTFLGTVAMMIVLSPILTAITFAMLAVMLLVVKTIGGRSRRYFAAQQKAIGDVNGYIEEMIEGQKVIKVFNHEDAAKAGFAGLNETYRDAATKAQAYAGAMMPAMGNLSHINYAITCCVGGLLAIRSGDLGGLAAFLQYTKQVSQPITQISQQVNTILSAVAGAERVFEIMETEPEVDDGQVTLEENGKRIHLLSIIGEIEGHDNLSGSTKTTKYEHILPELAKVESDEKIGGVLILVNTIGGDVSCGLALAEMIASLSKPTVSLVIGDSHSIGVPLAVASDYSFIVPTGTMLVHPVRMSGMVIGTAQTYEYFEMIEERIISFVSEHSRIDREKMKRLMHNTKMLTKDLGTVLVGKEAVECGLIDGEGGIRDAIEKLNALIKND